MMFTGNTYSRFLSRERLVYCSPAELRLGLFGMPTGAVQLLEGGRAVNGSADGLVPPLPPEPPTHTHTHFPRSGASKQLACSHLKCKNKSLQSYPFFIPQRTHSRPCQLSYFHLTQTHISTSLGHTNMLARRYLFSQNVICPRVTRRTVNQSRKDCIIV